jgi:uncharacterized phage protein gp47/JayE
MASTDNFKLLKDLIQSRAAIATNTGSVVESTILTPLATLLNRLEVLQEFNVRLQTPATAAAIASDSAFLNNLATAMRSTETGVLVGISLYIDKLASMYGITREPATYATGFVYFARTTPCESDLIIPAGTIVYSSTTSQRYETTESRTMLVASAGSYFNTDYQLYMIPVPIKSLASGVSGNIGEELIDSVETSVVGFTWYKNIEAIVNGVDAETDVDLSDRITLALEASNYGTIAGYKRFILENSDVSDAYVAGQGDPFMTRDLGDGGSVDIYLLERNLVTTSDIVDSFDPLSPEYILLDQPAKAVTSIVGAGTGTWTFQEDTTSVYAGSTRAQSKIVWSTPPSTPYTVNYTYDENVSQLQTLVETPEFDFAGSDVMIKEGTQIDIDVSCSIKISQGYTDSVVVANVITAVTNAISAYRLDEDVEQSDILSVITGVAGVDQVVLPLSKFNKSTLTGVASTIAISGKEFARLNAITIGVTP